MHAGNGSSFAPFCVRLQRYTRDNVGAVVPEKENTFQKKEKGPKKTWSERRLWAAQRSLSRPVLPPPKEAGWWVEERNQPMEQLSGVRAGCSEDEG